MIIAIDPGPEKSALVIFEEKRIIERAYASNSEIIEILEYRSRVSMNHRENVTLAIEMIACYRMAVGAEVFETCVWIGRFIEAYKLPELTIRVPRIKVKNHLCHTSKANDSNIRQAIIDRFGGKERAIGTKKEPGPLYGISGDLWAALAVALWAWDTQAARKAGAA